jgi:toxin-antitoxin system PIN domain toxin
MTTFLLDINVLLALADSAHVHHVVAHEWFGRTGQKSWATCPITENGFVRIASHPEYPNRPGGSNEVIKMLKTMSALEGHHFWPDTVSLRAFFPSTQIIPHLQITDLYLLGLAIHHGGKLATLDRRIPADLIRGGKSALILI